MRRSVILISVILTLCIALGVWMDVSQQRVAREYLDSVRLIRDLSERVREARGETLFRVNVYDRDAHVSLSLFSKSYKVSLTQSLVGYLEDNDIKYSIA